MKPLIITALYVYVVYVHIHVDIIDVSGFLKIDEPTTGMDPRIRRDIWNLILRMKEDRVTIMTTHVSNNWCHMIPVCVLVISHLLLLCSQWKKLISWETILSLWLMVN